MMIGSSIGGGGGGDNKIKGGRIFLNFFEGLEPASFFFFLLLLSHFFG